MSKSNRRKRDEQKHRELTRLKQTGFVRVRRDGGNVEQWLDTFEHECPVNEVLDRAKQAVNEYLHTEEGMQIIRENYGDFNWGDAMMMMSREDWEKHGLRLLPETPELIEVDQDECLVPKDLELPELFAKMKQMGI
jgi:hypothetical protein